MLWLPFMVAFVPAALTFILPTRWALAWMGLLWASFFAFYSQLDLIDDPAFIGFAVIFGFFLPVNALATMGRLFVIIAEAREKGENYVD